MHCPRPGRVPQVMLSSLAVLAAHLQGLKEWRGALCSITGTQGRATAPCDMFGFSPAVGGVQLLCC